MNTKIVQYATGDAGYTAMVEDFKEAFRWDSFPEYSAGSEKYTTFRMHGGNGNVGLQVMRQNSYSPKIAVYAYNGS